MISEQQAKSFLLPPVVTTTGTVLDMSFDRSGFDYCVIDIFNGTNVTTTQMWSTIIVSESDTITSATSMTDIVALSGSTATSTTYGFAIPTLDASAIGSLITLQFDLKARKKYIGLTLTASNDGASAHVGAIAKLSRGKVSPITATQRDGINLVNTAVNGCFLVVTAQ